MSIATSNTASEFSPFPIRRFTVDEYHRLAELGVLSAGERVELLEGWLVPKMIHNPAHDGTIELLDDLLRPMLPEGWRLRIQSVVTTGDSEPEPDIAIVRGPAGRYLSKHPGAADIALVIEVAESSLDRDRHKRRLYARAGIVCYWIVNLVDRKVEVYGNPVELDGEPVFSTHEDFFVGVDLPVEVSGMRAGLLRVSELFPDAS